MIVEILTGRITKDLELQHTADSTAYLRFTLACKEKFKNTQGEYVTQFKDCVVWRNVAETLAKNLHKGDQFIVVASPQTRSFTKGNGEQVQKTEYVVTDFEFVAQPKSERQEPPAEPYKLEPLSAEDEENLPF